MLTLLAAMLIELNTQNQAVERGPLVRLRPDGVVERFDENEFRFKATGSRFVPVPALKPLPSVRPRKWTPVPRPRPLELPAIKVPLPRERAFPDRWDASIRTWR